MEDVFAVGVLYKVNGVVTMNGLLIPIYFMS